MVHAVDAWPIVIDASVYASHLDGSFSAAGWPKRMQVALRWQH